MNVWHRLRKEYDPIIPIISWRHSSAAASLCWFHHSLSLLSCNLSFFSTSTYHLRNLRRYVSICCSSVLLQIRGAGSRPWHAQTPRFASTKKHFAQRFKNNKLDNLLTLEKKRKLALRLKKVLSNEKAHAMSLDNFSKLIKILGLSRKKRFEHFASNYPRLFYILKEKDEALWMEFANEVGDVLQEERQYMRHVHEPWLVKTLRKLLMMSVNSRLAIDKVCHLKHEFGLPDDFCTNLVHNYPQYFRVLHGGGGHGAFLELTDWDPCLAVTARERHFEVNSGEIHDLIGENTSYAFKIDNPKRFARRKKPRELMARFQTLPFPSPYVYPRGLGENIIVLEKRTVALVHEILSLTLQKRAVLEHILHFRKEFRLPHQMLQLLLHHREIFYVSLKGDRQTVFLKEAYEGSNLKENSPLINYSSRLAELCMQKQDKAGSDDGQVGEKQNKEVHYNFLKNINENEFDEEEVIGEDNKVDGEIYVL